MDLGLAKSIDAAQAALARYRITVVVGADAACSESGQACLLTIVNTGARSCAGGIHVVGPTGAEPLLTPLARARNLGEAIHRLGGQLGPDPTGPAPSILLGDTNGFPASDPAVRATYSGWCGGVSPDYMSVRLEEDSIFPPSAILAGALAVSECFAHLIGLSVMACNRTLGASLANPGADWRKPEPAQAAQPLPAKLWLLGLGHLGQAYAWTLASLPYPEDKKPIVYLQDSDIEGVTLANLSTSMLSHSRHLTRPKTRIVSRWLELRGFTTRLIEREFNGEAINRESEPTVLLCGVDNLHARRMLEKPGFDLVIDAGLGATGDDYDGFFVQSFTNKGRAATAFPEPTRSITSEDRIAKNREAYESLGLDTCGMIQAAGIAAGVPFVGAAVSAFVIAQAVSAIDGRPLCDTIAGNLHTIDSIRSFGEGTTIRSPGFIPSRRPRNTLHDFSPEAQAPELSSRW